MLANLCETGKGSCPLSGAAVAGQGVFCAQALHVSEPEAAACQSDQLSTTSSCCCCFFFGGGAVV